MQNLSDEDFKRSTFARMLLVVEQGLRNFGRPLKLRRADQLLLTLMCWRDCRTEYWPCFMASAGRLCAGRRMIKKIENTMIKSEQFHLTGAKEIQSSMMEIEIILVDAAEQPIERLQKTAAVL
ncbi:hypothetical protein VU06_00315 [Desulfobulbus sp. F3]|nr:hypothetical protein [Desulfobulbus sp. F3]